ncbi:MAG: stage III sporulation protein AE [Clostridiales bacterium]|nr:stage III sporulation protein AE [Clostridiales bacterium]
MRRIILFFAVLLLLSPQVVAADTEAAAGTAGQTELYDTSGLQQALPSDVLDTLDGLSPTEEQDLVSGVADILASATQDAGGFLRAALRTAAVVMAAVMLCGLLSRIDTGISANGVAIAGVLAITAACAGSLGTMLSVGQQTLDRIQTFSTALLPTMAAATVAVGAVNASAAIYAGTVMFSNFLILLTNTLLMPLVYAYVAACAADAAIGNDSLKQMAGLIRWAIVNGLKILLLVFTGFLTITGVISGTADAATVKAAKLTLSGMVPVVGSIIGDASETVLVSAGILRSTVGVFGMLAVLGICAAPFLQIGLHYLTLKVTAAVSGIIGDKRLSGLVEALGSAMSFILAMTGACALILLISCVCSMKAVSV